MQAGLRDIRLGEYRAAGPGTPSEAQDADTRIEDGIADYRRAAAEFEKLVRRHWPYAWAASVPPR